ncbi:pyridoxal phosphate-dependent transferase [Cokeromyces recurvatus]|uniref:pyridoxal phosphate-dependent transferase n=1 Tax=Cokeromyces recurvatus TaxID=90255 RepID=UPI0022211FF6|nr:pyridoxal phosphate-dependent transferase [Cokeromyces recurvatus]KAI7907647.1 pyridoxal phosphate-dependent transferase [Cokeromyces recurvatus]
MAEHESKAHQTLRSYPGNENKAERAKSEGNIHGIEHPGSTGVIYVMDRAMKQGFTYSSKEWSNFGQGAPEVGPIEGCMERPMTIEISQDCYEYAPTSGIPELRKAVADLYNEVYRKDKQSKYTYENVCIVPGGRAGLTRVAAAIGDVNVGYFLPEYTAYEQMLSVFKRFVPIPTTLEEAARYHIDSDTIRKEISGRGLGVIVASNPRNPTGQVIQDEELEELVAIAKERHTTLVMDEFYSAYIYDKEEGKTVSISRYVEDVNEDPVILIDGLTKNFRMPGWRVCWIVGPKAVISSMESAGSFLEGGANHPLQKAAIQFLDPKKFRNEVISLQRHFKQKRDYVLKRLDEMGLHVKVSPNATFYVWLDLSHLPEPINIGLNFFEECLKEKVIVVPGIFFDVNPSHRRELFESPCHHFVRLSFGPPLDQIKLGLDLIEKVIKKWTNKV